MVFGGTDDQVPLLERSVVRRAFSRGQIGGNVGQVIRYNFNSEEVSIQQLNGSITGLSSEETSRAKLDLEGKVDRYAPATIDGEMNLLSA